MPPPDTIIQIATLARRRVVEHVLLQIVAYIVTITRARMVIFVRAKALNVLSRASLILKNSLQIKSREAPLKLRTWQEVPSAIEQATITQQHLMKVLVISTVGRVELQEMPVLDINSISIKVLAPKLVTLVKARQRLAQIVTTVVTLLIILKFTALIIQVDLQSDRRNKACITRHPRINLPARSAMEETLLVPTVSASSTQQR